MQSKDFDEAMAAAKEGKIHGWVLSFLRSSGNNTALATKLEKSGQYHIGPIDYPIDEVINILGPDKTYKFYEDEAELTARVAAMVNSIKSGWNPPPLIVTNLWNKDLEIADGGHRQRALLAAGLIEYPVIFYFRDEATMNLSRGATLNL